MQIIPLVATLWARSFLSDGVSPFWIPLAGIACATIIALGVVAMVMHTRQQMQRLDYDLQLRRMEHERRMKELELELARVRGTNARAASSN